MRCVLKACKYLFFIQASSREYSIELESTHQLLACSASFVSSNTFAIRQKTWLFVGWMIAYLCKRSFTRWYWLNFIRVRTVTSNGRISIHRSGMQSTETHLDCEELQHNLHRYSELLHSNTELCHNLLGQNNNCLYLSVLREKAKKIRIDQTVASLLTSGIEFIRFQSEIRIFVCISQIFFLKKMKEQRQADGSQDLHSWTDQKVQKRQIRRR